MAITFLRKIFFSIELPRMTAIFSTKIVCKSCLTSSVSVSELKSSSGVCSEEIFYLSRKIFTLVEKIHKVIDMKKFLSFIMFFVMMITLTNICSAHECENSPYYIYVTNSQGKIYLYLRTVNVHEYNPPHYQIAGDFIWVNGDKERRFKVVVKYNWDKKETYHRNEGYWTKDATEYENYGSKRNRQMADALFRAAYGMDFYGY